MYGRSKFHIVSACPAVLCKQLFCVDKTQSKNKKLQVFATTKMQWYAALNHTSESTKQNSKRTGMGTGTKNGKGNMYTCAI